MMNSLTLIKLDLGKISFLNELSCSEGKLGLVEVEQTLEVNEDFLDCFRPEKSFNCLTPTRPENIQVEQRLTQRTNC